eukprot:TRINITY_DN6866_c0_g1_i2.p1 TRINITY_DN6866_c0_g1~~TRINITY_DN6866_c0_g1_i2.p1  ORF type:complete len:120 (+),score=8.84 TRINITY_DN6866_c0_g1_i2:175-534(+)
MASRKAIFAVLLVLLCSALPALARRTKDDPECSATHEGFRAFETNNYWPKATPGSTAVLGNRLVPMVKSQCAALCGSLPTCRGFVYSDGVSGKAGCQLMQGSPTWQPTQQSMTTSYLKC